MEPRAAAVSPHPRTSTEWPILLHWIHGSPEDDKPSPSSFSSISSQEQCLQALHRHDEAQFSAGVLSLSLPVSPDASVQFVEMPCESLGTYKEDPFAPTSESWDKQHCLGRSWDVDSRRGGGMPETPEDENTPGPMPPEGLLEHYWESVLHIEETGKKGRFGICSAPGKKSKRQGIHWERELADDLLRLRDHYGVTTILCLLNVYELRAIGVEGYDDAVSRLGMRLVHFPIIEMAAPISMDATDELVLGLMDRMAGGEVIAIHCRCGLGRSGTIAACLLLRLGLCKTAPQAIGEVRKLRSKLAVESWSQEKFVHKYAREFCRDL